MSDLDDLVVLDPDDREFGAVRRQPSPLPVPAVRYPADALPAAVVVPSGGGTVLGPVGEQAIPIARTQAHTLDIAPGSLPRVPAAEKIAHEAHEPPALVSPFVGGGVDPANITASTPGVIHQTGDIAEPELIAAGSERTGSGFGQVLTTGGAVRSPLAGNEKAADDAAGTTLASDQIQPVSAPISAVSAWLPSSVLSDLLSFAAQRLAQGAGDALLAAIGLNQPTLVSAYRLGVLPLGWQQAVPTRLRELVSGLRLTGAVIVPAFDAAGNVVDLLALHPRPRGISYVSICDPPRGLLAPGIATAHHDLILTDSAAVVARRFAAGQTDAVLVRGVADVAANAARFAAAGVRRVLVRARSDAEQMAASLRQVGIAVGVATTHPQSDDLDYDTLVPLEPLSLSLSISLAVDPVASTAPVEALPFETVPESTPTTAPVAAASLVAGTAELRLLTHDRQAERATFSLGSTTFVVEVPHDVAVTRLEVVTRHAGQVHREIVDLAVEAARHRYAGNASLRCGIPSAIIATQMPHLLAEVQALHHAMTAPPAEDPEAVPPGPERDDALVLLRSPDLMDRLVGDLETLGWVGEADAKRVLLLTAISRKLPEPLWAVRTASNDVISDAALDVIAAITPPEDVLHLSRLSPAALNYQDEHALAHKLLVIDEASALTPEAILTLRVLRSRGAFSQASVPRHHLSGSARTQTTEIRGPIALISATAGRLERQVADACCLVPVDESAEQTARMLAAERHRFAQPPAADADAGTTTRRVTLRRYHTVNRLIARRPVVIPFADRIEFPAITLRRRQEQSRFLALIAASALLHQHQRLGDRGHVVADVRDFDRAVSLAATAGIGVDDDHGLGRPAVALLSAVQQAGLTSFTVDQIRALLPQWGRSSFRSAVADLLRHDYVAAAVTGPGVVRRYDLLVQPGEQPVPAPVITLRPVNNDCHLVRWLVPGQSATSQLNSQERPEIDAVG